MLDNPTTELLKALSEFQSAVLAAPKDKEAYNYMYATEKSIVATIQPIKAKGGCCHTFHIASISSMQDGQPGLTQVELRLYHAESGGLLTSSLIVPDYEIENRKTPRHQQRGAAITYAKRYLLAAMFGISTDDNEGESITAPEEKPKSKSVQPVFQQKPNTPKQAQNKPTPKQTTDPLEKDKAELQKSLNDIYSSGDKDVLNLWRHYVKNRWNGNISVPESNLKIEHLNTVEMVEDTKNWLTQYNQQKVAS